ncbi:MAG: exo-beta-N-acetylmuramidase NamZ domain-containing protein [Bryobacterales bacterium]
MHQLMTLPCRVLVLLLAACLSLPADWQGSERLDEIVGRAIEERAIPGAVLLVSHNGVVVHRKAYGNRTLVPSPEPMTLDTIFDCASLTKVVATTTAVMMLVEEGKLRLTDRVTKYLPDFASGRSPITIEQLLTHYSGLRPDVDLEPVWEGYETGIRLAYREKPVSSPGSRFIYSDINYILLGEIVRVVSGKPLDEFAKERLFEPLGMVDSGFRPDESLIPRIAPTERLADGTILRGVVHDPTTRFMGGLAGHAGLFSTADDLSRFAKMMLNGGGLDGRRILNPLAIVKMTTPQSPRGREARRGFGWDFDSPYSSVRGDLFLVGSYGHTGFTGTSIWIDPFTKTYVILLTNRVHPTTRTSVVNLRSQIASAVAASLTGLDVDRLRLTALGLQAATAAAEPEQASGEGKTVTGLDVLVRDEFASFRGKRVGLITNHTGIDRLGRRNVDLFANADGVTLQTIFSPEHGLQGLLDQEVVDDARDAATGVRVFSLYQGDRRRPTAEMLQDIDVLVFDIQDIGARFYTYITTMAYAMEEAATHKIPFYVLDRPNPITGLAVEGPILDESYRSFIGYFEMPVRHGMTIGEVAKMFNVEGKIGAQLEVIRMEDWRREQWFDETGLPWVDPSPNMRNLQQALLYPGVAMLEGLSNYSVGRGTDTPFEFVGADWISGPRLAEYLNRRGLPGVRFYAVRRTPQASRFAGKTIDGVQISVLQRDRVESTRLGLEIAAALFELYPGRVQLAETARLIANQQAIRAIEGNENPNSIWSVWEMEKEGFLEIRSRYLLY